MGARYVEGTCFTYGESISYLPFLDMVRTFFGLEEGGDEAAAKRQIDAYLATLALEPAAVVPYLHNLLSFTVDDAVFPRLTPELIRQRTVAALAMLTVAEAHARPLVLILEDVHWIDTATEEVIYPTSRAPQREYSFKHVLTQEAVYGTLLRPQREMYHEWIGEALEGHC